MLCLNLIYGISFLLCHGLRSYIILSYLVTEKGQTGGTEQDQCSASFYPWYIFLWGVRPESEPGGAWVIPAFCGLECKAPCKTIPGQAVGTTDPFIFHGDPFKKFASRYVAAMEARATLPRPAQCSARDSQLSREPAHLLNRLRIFMEVDCYFLWYFVEHGHCTLTLYCDLNL